MFFPTSTANNGPGTLRQAILDANALPPATDGSLVYIDLTLLQTAAAPARAEIDLTSGGIEIKRSMIILAGNALPLPRIRCTVASALRASAGTDAINVILQNLRFESCRSLVRGGAIDFSSAGPRLELQADGCEFVDNAAGPDTASSLWDGIGGAINFVGHHTRDGHQLKIIRCLFENNRALSLITGNNRDARGAAVRCDDAKVVVEDSVFRGNSCDTNYTFSGAALWLADTIGTCEIRRCTFEGNTADTMGISALYFTSSSGLLLEDSHFEGNTGGPAMAIKDTQSLSSGTATINNCTFVNNGGFITSGLIVTADFGPVDLTHCTFWNNRHGSPSGSALKLYHDGNNISFSRTVVAENDCDSGTQLPGWSPDIYMAGTDLSAVTSDGYNFIGDSDQSPGVFIATGDRAGTRTAPLVPRLADPGNYGGPVRSCPPLPDSPLVDAIPNLANVLPTDQLGLARPQGFTADIGAVELPRVSFDVWVNQIPDSKKRGPKMDPDGDGLQNRQEYFFGTDPTIPNSAPVRMVETESGRFLEVVRSATVRPLYFTRADVETSTDLNVWTAAEESVSSSPETEGALDRIRIFHPAGSDLRRFFRAAVE